MPLERVAARKRTGGRCKSHALARVAAICAAIVLGGILACPSPSDSATTQPRYYAHTAVEDSHGVISSWYAGQNGPFDLRVRIAAETLKRYPWTDTSRAIAALPEYMFNGTWSISSIGAITPLPLSNWNCGDLAAQAAFVLGSLVSYYAYSGDPAAIAHLTLQADMLLDYAQTDTSHAWPNMLITNPIAGTPYGRWSPAGWIQLDFVGDVGLGLLKAYRLTGKTRWLDAAKHWGDLLATHRRNVPGESPWTRYAVTDTILWNNRQTGGAVLVTAFLDELIKLGYTGQNNSIVAARDAGEVYLRDVLLPAWTVNETFGRNYWDWEQPTQAGMLSLVCVDYLMDHKDTFPNWRNDVRNILSLYINHTCVDSGSNGEVYSGAWAFPESLSCCGRSLWYEPLYYASTFARYGIEADSEWARELARRMEMLAMYDIHETGVSEDNIDGGAVVCAGWFKLACPAPLEYTLATMGWLPDKLGAARENHIMRTASVVTTVVYGEGSVRYTTFAAPENCVDVLRLAFVPSQVTANGQALQIRSDLAGNGYTVKPLANGDCVVSIRHDGATSMAVVGDDPQSIADDGMLAYEGSWQILSLPGPYGTTCHTSVTTGSVVRYSFTGNQVRLIGTVAADGGLADVYIDGEKQLVGIDCWNLSARHQQVLYYKNGLEEGQHELRTVVKGRGNPVSSGRCVYVDALQWSDATGGSGFGEGGGPTDAQRFVMGYPGRQDIVDSAGNTWRPGTEFVVRLGPADSVAGSWWTTPWEAVSNTPDPDLYRYGVHGRELITNFTVGPGTYYVRLKFAATRITDTRANCMDVDIAGVRRVTGLDVVSTAGGTSRAVDLVFNDVLPRNGIIEVRLRAGMPENGTAEAFVQAIEVGPGHGGTGANPITVTQGNLLVNPAFDEGCPSQIGSLSPNGTMYGWSWTLDPSACLRSEKDSPVSPVFVRSAPDALQMSADYRGGQTGVVYQVVNALPGTEYRAGTYTLASGEFGALPGDAAGLWIRELAGDGSVAVDHGLVGVTSPSGWVNREVTFISRPQTAQIWYGLKTRIGCRWDTGRVVFDDCYLQLPSTLSGTVTRGGLLLGGASVTVQDKTVTTGANGRYILPGLSASTATVTFAQADCRTITRRFVLRPGSNTLDVEMPDGLLENPGFEDGVTIYSGTGSSGGKGWQYSMTSGDNAVRPESFYDGGTGFTGPFAPEYRSGLEALRFRTSLGGGSGVIYQEADVRPETLYQASVWVRAYGTFGNHPDDRAGIWIQQLDSSGNVILDSGQSLVRSANVAYEQRTLTFTTTAATTRVRFLLISVVTEYYAQAAVTYDDCDLRDRSEATLSGTVTSEEQPVEGAAVSAQGKSALTAADGSYTLAGLTNSPCTVVCSKEGHAAVSRVVTPSKGSNTLDIELPPPGIANLLANPGFEDGVAYCSGSTTGGGYGWSYWMDSGHAIRPESFYAGDLFAPNVHGGQEAIRFRCNLGGGQSEIYQLASVLPGKKYTATAWVRTYSSGQGFGHDTNDTAGISVEEYDASAALLAGGGESVVHMANTDYQRVSTTFTTNANTSKVRFVLRTVTASSYQTGAVSYDDCSLEGPYAPASLSGAVTCSGVALAGATVAVQGVAAVTDGAGLYALSGLKATTAEAGCSKPRYWPSSRQIELAAGSNSADFELAPMAANNLLANGGFEQGVTEFSGAGSNAGGHGWSYEWTSGTNGARRESYYDGLDVDRMPAREFHSGGEAVRFSSSGPGAGSIRQIVAVQPDMHYTASAWIRGCDVAGQGFGHGSGDRAGIWIRTLDGAGNVLEDIGEVSIHTSSPGYQYVANTFNSGSAEQVMFALHTVIESDYSEGSVAYDDCALEPFSGFPRVGDLRSVDDGAPSSVAGKVVAAALDGFFYIQEHDRSSGIKVIGTASAGDVVSVSGRIETVNGERTLISAPGGVSATPGGATPAPFGMTNFCSGATIATGLFATVWGQVLSVDAATNSFTISDGSDSAIKVYGSPGGASYVRVIGAIGAELRVGQKVPVVHSVTVVEED